MSLLEFALDREMLYTEHTTCARGMLRHATRQLGVELLSNSQRCNSLSTRAQSPLRLPCFSSISTKRLSGIPSSAETKLRERRRSVRAHLQFYLYERNDSLRSAFRFANAGCHRLIGHPWRSNALRTHCTAFIITQQRRPAVIHFTWPWEDRGM